MIVSAHPAPEPVSVPEDQEPASSSSAKTLALLSALLTARHGTLGVTEAGLAVGLPKSTAHRLLKVLEEQGFVSRAGTRYRIGGRSVELGEVARWSEHGELRDAAYRPLAGLFERADAIAVHLGVLRGRSVFYVDKLMRPEGTRLPSRVGGRFPATCTGLGKVMLAFSDEVALETVLAAPLPRPTPYSVGAPRRLLDQLARTRDAGYSIEREEACQGTVCVAAPVLKEGRAIAAVSVCVSSAGLSGSRESRLAVLGRLAVETAGLVARQLPQEDAGSAVPAGGTAASCSSRTSA